MVGRVVVTGVVLVIIVAVLVHIVEFFLPLSQKSDMDIVCRDTLLKMENAGGLTTYEKQDTEQELKQLGFRNITIDGTSSARQGGPLSLHVEADYSYVKMTALFVRRNMTQHMSYEKTSMSRKVVN